MTGVGRLEHVEVPIAGPGDGEVLVRVLSVGLCGSDAHWFEEGGIGDATLSGGLILGHEVCGVIETGPRAGERVALDPAIPCQVCEQCVVGRPHLCLRLRFAGHGSTDGGLRRHMVWPDRCLVPIPDHVTDPVGALLEPLGVALHAIDLAAPEPGWSAAVVGCGPIGLLLVAALLQRRVARVVASDRLGHRTAAATELGATAIPATEDDDELENWREVGDGGFDVVFETAGTDTALHSALSAARPGARVVLVGIPAGDRTGFVASVARRKELTINLCRRMVHEDLVRAAGLVDGGLRLDDLVTHSYRLTEADQAFATLSGRRGLKVIVTP